VRQDGASPDLLGALLAPRSIAVVGASENRDKLGGRILGLLKDYGFVGNLWAVNAKAAMVQGVPSYPSVAAIPDAVERVQIAVPSHLVPQVIADCVSKGVRVAQIISSGFGESGERGKDLEVALVATAREAGLRIVGPNCIGTYSPQGRMTFSRGVTLEAGGISVVSQSGGIAYDLLLRGEHLGLRFRTVLSVGNCIDLDVPDYLDLLAGDSATRVIVLYIEGVRDGRRFIEAARRVTQRTPVLALKGGRSAAGGAASASHTGRLAGSYQVYEAVFRQTGIRPVLNVDELLVGMMACSYPVPQDHQEPGIALVGNGGGATVLAVDRCDDLGLSLSRLSPEGCDSLARVGMTNIADGGNPLDVPAPQLAADGGRVFGKILSTLCAEHSVGAVLIHLNLLPFMNMTDPEAALRAMVGALLQVDRRGKRLVAVLRSHGAAPTEDLRQRLRAELLAAGLPAFNSVDEGLLAIQVSRDTRICHGGEPEC
jgi:acyl-CoA synthetase (NDP forming)